MAAGYVPYDDAESGLRFLLAVDETDPTLLHIFARHLTSPADAMDTFFEGETTWNEERGRFETFSETHGLYWFWRVPQRVIVVVTCFRL